MDKMVTVEKVRKFNRFYTSVMSLLNDSYLNTDYSMTEARILYELYDHELCNANVIARRLHIDKSYLSRVLKKFEKKGLLTRSISPVDTRVYHIALTEKGIAETEMLISCSNSAILGLIDSFSTAECRKLEASVATITKLLSDNEEV